MTTVTPPAPLRGGLSNTPLGKLETCSSRSLLTGVGKENSGAMGEESSVRGEVLVDTVVALVDLPSEGVTAHPALEQGSLLPLLGCVLIGVEWGTRSILSVCVAISVGNKRVTG